MFARCSLIDIWGTSRCGSEDGFNPYCLSTFFPLKREKQEHGWFAGRFARCCLIDSWGTTGWGSEDVFNPYCLSTFFPLKREKQ